MGLLNDLEMQLERQLPAHDRGITLPGDDACYQRFSKNPGPDADPGLIKTELRPCRPMDGLRQEHRWPVPAADAVDGTTRRRLTWFMNKARRINYVRFIGCGSSGGTCGEVGFADPQRLLQPERLAEGQHWARRLIRLPPGGGLLALEILHQHRPG